MKRIGRHEKLVSVLVALLLFLTTGSVYAETEKSHQFPWGYCTWGCANDPSAPYIAYIPFSGNAILWKDKAVSAGFVVKDKPYQWAIVVFDYNHVATVIKVDGRNFRVSEVNYVGYGKRSERWITYNSSEYKRIKGFIMTRKAIKDKYEEKDKDTYERYKKQYKKCGIWYDGQA